MTAQLKQHRAPRFPFAPCFDIGEHLILLTHVRLCMCAYVRMCICLYRCRASIAKSRAVAGTRHASRKVRKVWTAFPERDRRLIGGSPRGNSRGASSVPSPLPSPPACTRVFDRRAMI